MRRIRVFVADDSGLFRSRVRELLRGLRDVTPAGEASTVAQACHDVAGAKADVVVLDFRFQDGNGLDVLREIAHLTPRPAVVVLTNYAFDEIRDRCMDEGAGAFLNKHTQFSLLPSVVCRLAAGRRGRGR